MPKMEPTITLTRRKEYALNIKGITLDGRDYLILKSGNRFHVFAQADTKEFAERNGITHRGSRNAQSMMAELWDSLS